MPLSKTLRRWVLVCFAPLLSCSGTDTEIARTKIILIPTFQDSWQLTQLELSAGTHHAFFPSAPGTILSGTAIPIALSNEDEVGKVFPIDVWGLKEGKRIAWGMAQPTPILYQTVEAPVTLTKLPCGSWCTPGSVECYANGTRQCQERASDGCTEWSEVSPCPSAMPTCSLGQCAARCVDECTSGMTRCAGPASVQNCGNSDSDDCEDWLEPSPCPADQVCEGGVCQKQGECADECTANSTRCVSNGVASCGQFDTDPCLDWSPATSCPEGQSCSNNVCAPTADCSDECNTGSGTCEGSAHRTCGQYDLDPCVEWSPETSCKSDDSCLVGACDPTRGCIATPRLCASPPEDHCQDHDTKIVYDATGSCSEGECHYPSREVTCANCPSCDPCLNVDCATPPSTQCLPDGRTLRTYNGPGTCKDGTCEFIPTDRVCEFGCFDGACQAAPKNAILLTSTGEATWRWSNSGWTKWQGTPKPAIGHTDGMALAAYDGGVLLFTGVDDTTWKWDGATWSKLKSQQHPVSNSADVAMAAVDSNLILFTGYDDTTWEWNGKKWSKLRTPSHPNGAGSAGVAMASMGSSALLFTGSDSSTWEWNTGAWVKLSPARSPVGFGTGMAMTSHQGKVYLFTGDDNALWEWNGSDWLKRDSSVHPYAHYDSALGMTSVGPTILLFSGYDDGTWSWDGLGWTKSTVKGPQGDTETLAAMASY